MKFERKPFVFEKFFNRGLFFTNSLTSFFIFLEIHKFINEGVGFQSHFKILVWII